MMMAGVVVVVVERKLENILFSCFGFVHAVVRLYILRVIGLVLWNE